MSVSLSTKGRCTRLTSSEFPGWTSPSSLARLCCDGAGTGTRSFRLSVQTSVCRGMNLMAAQRRCWVRPPHWVPGLRAQSLSALLAPICAHRTGQSRCGHGHVPATRQYWFRPLQAKVLPPSRRAVSGATTVAAAAACTGSKRGRTMCGHAPKTARRWECTSWTRWSPKAAGYHCAIEVVSVGVRFRLGADIRRIPDKSP